MKLIHAILISILLTCVGKVLFGPCDNFGWVLVGIVEGTFLTRIWTDD